jgi:protocatechuate 3,4-dioxygenase, beta subunit
MTDLALPRRTLLKTGLAATAAGLLLPDLALAGDPTPAQTEGPFHPLQRRRTATGAVVQVDARLRKHVDKDADLTFVSDRPGVAYGTVVLVDVTVLSADGDRPLTNANVEVWQACASGRYNHRSDPSTEWLDPSFQYWGRSPTGVGGGVLFRTVIPGAYQASPGWVRPPHIHVKASAPGHRELTTQWYFEGVRFYYQNRTWTADDLRNLNARDQVLAGVPLERRGDVVSQARLETVGAERVRRARYTLRLEKA